MTAYWYLGWVLVSLAGIVAAGVLRRIFRA